MSSAAIDRVRPGPASPRGNFEGTVKENKLLCTDHYKLVLSLPRFRRSQPGQFVQIECADPKGSELAHEIPPRTFEWGPEGCVGKTGPVAGATDADFIAPLAYLRRPFSIADHRIWPDGYSEIDIIHRVVGKGTLFMAQLEVGQKVSVIGPLGRGFDVPDGLELACMVGGGVGIPPMIYLAKALRRDKFVENAVAFIGAQREDLLPITFNDTENSPIGDPLLNVAEFCEHGYPAVISTDDGSRGMKGFVTQALDRFLEEREVQKGTLTNTVIYCCGPTPMMKATARVAAEYGVPCQVSLEQPMACGMGTCQSCVIKYRPHNAPVGADWKYKLTCTEGPVFDTRDIVW
jgi:dihydroorotate dehydrogenase electron transfer subunit